MFSSRISDTLWYEVTMMLHTNEFALRLARLREEKKVSAREMSLAIGQNHGYINSIESGKNLPTMKGFFYICDYLGITPEEFFQEEVSYPQEVREIVPLLKKLSKEELNAIRTVIVSMNRE